MINIKKVHEDARGKLFVMDEDGEEFAHLATIKAGASRGGHFHDEEEIIRILDGELDFMLTDSEGIGEEQRSSLSKGDEILLEAGMAHLLTAKEDSLLIGFLKKCRTEVYKPYRNVVESFRNNK